MIILNTYCLETSGSVGSCDIRSLSLQCHNNEPLRIMCWYLSSVLYGVHDVVVLFACSIIDIGGPFISLHLHAVLCQMIHFPTFSAVRRLSFVYDLLALILLGIRLSGILLSILPLFVIICQLTTSLDPHYFLASPL